MSDIKTVITQARRITRAEAENATLRAENARLREALAKCVYIVERLPTNNRIAEAVQIGRAALQETRHE